jgi:hypothetical protein
VRQHAAELLQQGARGAVTRGRIPCITTRRVGQDALLVRIHAEGHGNLSMVESIAQRILPSLFPLTNAPPSQPQLAIRTVERNLLQVICELTPMPLAGLEAHGNLDGKRKRSVTPSSSADHHAPEIIRDENKAILACLRASTAPIQLAWTTLERDALEHAMRWGRCEPLVRWLPLQRGLRGEMRLPLAILPSSSTTAPRATPQGLLALGALALTASLASRLGGRVAETHREAPASRKEGRKTDGGPADDQEEPTLVYRTPQSGVRPIVKGLRAG